MSDESVNDPGGEPGEADDAAPPGDVPPPPPPPPPSGDLSAWDPTPSGDPVPPPPPPPGPMTSGPTPAPASTSGEFAAVDPAAPGAEGGVPWQVPNPTPPWPTGGPDPNAPPPQPVPPSPPSPPGGYEAVPPGGAWGTAAPVPAPPPMAPPAAPYAPAPGYAPPPGPGYAPAPGYGPGPGPGYPGQVGPPPAPVPQWVDPHGVGQAVARLGSGGKRTGRVALMILAAVLEPDDVAEIVVTGKFRGFNAAATLAGTKVVVVNDREWKPDVVVIPVTSVLQVQGWQDDRSASLMFQDTERQEVVERIPDRLLAIEFAQRVRDRVATIPQDG